MPEQREGGLLHLLGVHAAPKHQHRNSLLPAHAEPSQHGLAEQFQHVHGHAQQIGADWITSTTSSASPAHSSDFEPGARELAGGGQGSLLDSAQPFSRIVAQSPSPQRSLTPDLQLPVVTDASILNLTSLSR